MALEKLKILVETAPDNFGDEFEVLFNPTEISIEKSAKWDRISQPERDTQDVQFLHGEPAKLSMDLFFDTSEKGTDVREHTRKIFNLATINGELHRPPICRLLWGGYDFDGFKWLIESVNQRFTLFRSSGVPVRATLTCSFGQWRSSEAEKKEIKLSSPDVAKRRTVRRGETLHSIAAEVYDDPASWRPIATANRIVNPRRIVPGQVLSIPVLRSGDETRR